MNNRLPILAAEIRHAHAVAQEAARTAAEQAIEAGHALLEARALVAHGGWLSWLREHVGISPRTAQGYMQLARSGVKSATVAHLGVRAALAEIASPKQRRLLPCQDHIRIGRAGDVELWIVPSYQHAGYFYATCIQGNEAHGTRRPVHRDFLDVVVRRLECDLAALEWTDEPGGAWAFNMLLFDDGQSYVDSLLIGDLQELIDLATERAPRVGDLEGASRSHRGAA